ncbi:gluconate 2-dehydrogenase subunit 3 family protein [Rheinheimera riviphila]|uniref:Gluconate 2-dehydrogenase subunit 3 family protein n=1 Tax=Rheinheimera riviphila TaxID=1834037 RepID=A0A437QCE1_9GAMM|nr:gluconate 2-dehydrogenase subunit 3 family protein [Rheinheimera riviphila]RVU32043.1 gluconate 2-dehydrogenase subunit 3 family protein [Rheinheimera riviphila]
MERRELLKMIAAATGMAFVGGEVWAAGLNNLASSAAMPGRKLFSVSDIALLDEIAETILPKTTTPGAKDAGCGAQMATQINDCYNATEQGWFVDGLKQLRARSQQDFKLDFMQLSKEQRHQLLVKLDAEAKARNAQIYAAANDSTNSRKSSSANKAVADNTPHYFTLLKQLTLFVFFTSKVGATEVLRYSAIPGKYEGALPYKKGDRAWAT